MLEFDGELGCGAAKRGTNTLHAAPTMLRLCAGAAIALFALGQDMPASAQSSDAADPGDTSNSEADVEEVDISEEGEETIGGTLEETSEQRVALFRYGLLNYIAPPWYKFKNKLSERTGIDVALTYKMSGQTAFRTPNPDTAIAGDFDIFAGWQPFKKEGRESTIGLNFEVRHTPTKLAPSELSLELGSIEFVLYLLPGCFLKPAKVLHLRRTPRQSC